MFRLTRHMSFWIQPWFLVFAIIAGQVYAGWWMNLGHSEPRYVPSQQMLIASAPDGFVVTITAPRIPGVRITAAN